jgi:hypothetical protein
MRNRRAPAAATRPNRAQVEQQRQAVLDRLHAQHPDWSGQQILHAALLELHRGADSEFMRQAAEQIAQWSQRHGVSLSAPRR